MAAPTNAARVKKVLANLEPSTHGPVTLNPDGTFHFKLRRCAFDAAQGTSG
jgi:hypothetical protein